MKLHLTKYALTMGLTLGATFGLAQSTNAIAVNSAECSAIDVTDGVTSDWESIPYLIQNDSEDITNVTTWYWDDTVQEWTDTEPASYRYSMTPDKWIDIQDMKQCNTSEYFKLYMKNYEPMMTFYDKENDKYYDLQNPVNEGEQLGGFPEAWEHWMVWKFQAANSNDSTQIFYMAADISIAKGSVGLGQGEPEIYFVQETTPGITFEEATFNPTDFSDSGDGFTGTSDKLLEQMAADDGDQDGQQQQQPTEADCEQNPELCQQQQSSEGDGAVDADQGFEVRQSLGNFFELTGFKYGEEIKTASLTYSNYGDTSTTAKYRFSKAGPKGLTIADEATTSSSLQVEWNKLKRARNYQVLVTDEAGAKVQMVRGVRTTTATITNLEPNTTYKIRVRAKYKGGRVSSWSELVSGTTTQ